MIYSREVREPWERLHSILEEAHKQFGNESRIQLCKEECMELALALQRLYRKRGNMDEKIENIIDEMADVYLTLYSLVKFVYPEYADTLASRIEYKLDRIETRITENLV